MWGKKGVEGYAAGCAQDSGYAGTGRQEIRQLSFMMLCLWKLIFLLGLGRILFWPDTGYPADFKCQISS